MADACARRFVLFFLMIRRPPRSTQRSSSAASDVYKRQGPGRCKTNVRLVQGQEIRVPPLAFDTRPADAPKGDVKPLSKEERRFFDSMVIHEDRDIYVLNKPSGFAAVSYTHLRAHETPEHLVCRLMLGKKKI